MMFTTVVDLTRRKAIFIRNFTFSKYTVIVSIIDLWNKGQDQIGEIALQKVLD